MAIELPKRSVTRFFIPLIDVLILLFCIFLFMPFVSRPADEDDPASKTGPDPTAQPLPATAEELQRQLERLRRQNKRLMEAQADPAQRVNVRVVQIDPRTGRLYYYEEGERREVADQREAQRLIDLHKRQSGAREAFFVLLRPPNSIYPLTGQVDQYNRWFQEVPHQFE